MDAKQLDIDKVLDVAQRTYSEWLDLIQTCDRDALLAHANDIRLSSALRDTDRPALYKRIALRLGCTSKALLDTLKAEFDGKAEGELDDRDLARATLDENLVYAADGFYLWRESGVWAPAHEREIRKRIGDVLKSNGLPVKDRAVAGVANVLKDEAYDTGIKFDEPQANRVNVSNGALELEGSTWTLREHRREDYLTSQLPVAYDPDATCPRFDQFLQEIFSGDKDAADKALLIREMFGYSLLPTCRYERFFLLVGQGANGKSVLLNLIKALVGAPSCSAVEPGRLDNRFQRAHVHRKLVNIVPELPKGAIIADASMKSFSSGDLVTAEHKGKDPFDFSPFATFITGTNCMPHSRDLSHGMERRAVILQFNQSFTGRADRNLGDKLLKELPGILASVLRAFSGVAERGDFTLPASCKEAGEDWRRDCDQVATWVSECCTIMEDPSMNLFTPFTDAYDSFKAWCDLMGVKHAVSGGEFGNRLEALGAKRDRSRVNGKQQRGFHHLHLNPPE